MTRRRGKSGNLYQFVKAGLTGEGLCYQRTTQSKAESASFTGNTGAFDPDTSTHCFNQLLADVEAKARTTNGAIHVPFQPHKALKEAGLLFWWHAQAMIAHKDAYLPVILAGSNLYTCTSRRILEGIIDKVQQHLAQTQVVSFDRKTLWDSHLNRTLFAPRHSLHNFQNVLHRLGQDTPDQV